MDRRDLAWYSLISVAVPGAGVMAYLLNLSRKSDMIAAVPLVITRRDGDLSFGDPMVPVAILAYVSLTCTHCRAWEETEMPRILDGLVASGKARLVIRDFPLDASAFAGAGVVHCLPPPLRRAAHAALMRSSDQWAASAARGAARLLATLMPDAISDPDALAVRAMSRDVQDYILAESLDATARYGILATPTFVAGRHVKSGVLSAETLAGWLSPGT